MALMSKVVRWVQDKIGVGENRARLNRVEKKLALSLALQRSILPEKLIFPAETFEMVSKWQRKSPNTSLEIHKNDIMFLFSLHHHYGNWEEALDEYFTTGHEMAQALATKANEHSQDIQSVLDFGSGYGRVSRFFPSVFTQAKVWVSEVKQQSLDFQREQFSFNTIDHTEDPSSFNNSKKFDLIFAGSVFTHLPENRFIEWLKILISSLSENGILIFSCHNLLDLQGPSKGRFAFIEHSEDQVMSEIGDRIKDANQYGSSYISHDYLAELIKQQNGKTQEVIRLGFGGTQDLCVVKKA